jgi:hypothetical protein
LRAVTAATAAAAIGLQKKALDNLLGRLDLPEAASGRQGVERRIPVTLLPALLLTAELTDQLDMPIRSAFALARRLVSGEVALGPFLSLRAETAPLSDEIDRQLEVAIETVVRRPRGRPRSTTEV